MTEVNNNRYALITGATSGIGYELAKLFAEDGYNLIIVARDENELRTKAEEFSGTNIDIVTISKDLFQPNAAFELYDEVKNKGLTVDVLVNDAGQGQYGLFVEQDIRRLLDIIQLNINSLTVLTHLFLKDMVARNEGKILQLASIASQLPGPWQGSLSCNKSLCPILYRSIDKRVERFCSYYDGFATWCNRYRFLQQSRNAGIKNSGHQIIRSYTSC